LCGTPPPELSMTFHVAVRGPFDAAARELGSSFVCHLY
jgi:hypothetical protein